MDQNVHAAVKLTPAKKQRAGNVLLRGTGKGTRVGVRFIMVSVMVMVMVVVKEDFST